MSDKWALRGFSTWLLLVAGSITGIIAAGISGYENISEFFGILFISLFLGAILTLVLAFAISLWKISNEDPNA